MWPAQQVQWAKQWPTWAKRVISHSFFTFLCKCINGAPLNALSSKCIIVSCIIIASYDVMSSCDMMMSLMMSSHMHVQQVT